MLNYLTKWEENTFSLGLKMKALSFCKEKITLRFNINKKMRCDVDGKSCISVRINYRFWHKFLVTYFSCFYKIQALRYLKKTLAQVLTHY
jgi:hypothetical protein